MKSIGRATACSNIALAKYWGKSPRGQNLTAVPSLSMTLDALRTRTEVSFDSSLERDEATLNGASVTGRPVERVTELLNRVRAAASEGRFARVTSINDFPTAAGLASSASGFAALTLAAAAAADLHWSSAELSDHARRSSASAGRSIFGGFVELLADEPSARPVAPPDHWDLAMLVVVVSSGPKPVGSTGGMLRTAETCPYYPAWLESAPARFERVRAGIIERDFPSVAEAMEQSTLLMHATMMTSQPPILYFRPATLLVLDAVQELRTRGEEVAFTMDAGPNVKVLTHVERASVIARNLKTIEGVESVIVCRPGPPAALLELDGALEDAAVLAVGDEGDP